YLLHQNDKKVIIDFVPNHFALDSQLAKSHPEYFIQGSQRQYESSPDFYFSLLARDQKTYYLAHGKDPNFPSWADTLQLNYGLPEVNLEMSVTLQKLVSHSDGVRCDMAMLLNPPTFLRTWGWALDENQKKYLNEHSFWSENIPYVKNNLNKNFKFIGEVYWDEDYLSQYFDYLYDDKFYKEITRSSSELKNHLSTFIDFKNKNSPCRRALYVENHDEERAVKTLGPNRAKAAAVLAAIIPDTMFIINQGQEKGWKVRPPMQINRFPQENDDPQIQKFYQKLFKLINSPLYKYGTLKSCQINQISGDTIALELSSSDKNSTALFCLNMGLSYSKCTIPSINKETPVKIESLTEEKEIIPDDNRQNGMYIGLDSGEVQVIYTTQTLPESLIKYKL
ncbi:MAG TPA: alpha-amylase family glycosyl hydrolase, partial [Patescibacteria group bacterium]